MGYSFVTYTGNGAQTDFAVPFPYIDQSHVEVSVNSVSTPFTFPNAATVRVSPAPANGLTVLVRRNSNRTARLVDFADSANLTEVVLDRDSNQLMYVAQEALDQASTQSYFQTDANGARVINVADPVNNQDAVTKKFLSDALSTFSVGVGTDIRPLNNTFTGTNLFNSTVSVKGAVFDGVNVATQDLLNLSKGLNIYNTTDNASYIGYGVSAQIRRAAGWGIIVGAQLDAIATGTMSAESIFGAATEAICGKTATGTVIGSESSAIMLNSNAQGGYRVGLYTVFKNRQDGASLGGEATAIMGVAGDGTGGNWYNTNSTAHMIDSQSRSDSGATFVGWNHGLLFRDNWCDVAKVRAWVAGTYNAGDYVTNSGHVFMCRVASASSTPTIGSTTDWIDLGVDTGTRKAVGIDFSSTSVANAAARMAGAIKFGSAMKFLWDSEEHISSYFDTAGYWRVDNDASARFGINVANGDILVNGSPRILGTRTQVSAHRNLSSIAISANTWTLLPCTYEEYDIRGDFNSGSGRFTATVSDFYEVVWQAHTESNTTGAARFYAAIYKNGALYKSGSIVTDGAVPLHSALCVCKVFLTAGDYIDTYVMCTTSVNISGEPSVTYLQISKAS